MSERADIAALRADVDGLKAAVDALIRRVDEDRRITNGSKPDDSTIARLRAGCVALDIPIDWNATVDPKGAERLLGRRTKTLTNLRQQGNPHGAIKIAGRWRYPLQALAAYLDRSRK